MKKETIWKILFTLSILLLAAFVVNTIIDYINYSTSFTSAPFSVFILVNAVMFILPSAILAIIGLIIKRKINRQKADCQDKKEI